MQEHVTNSAEETQKIGRDLAGTLKGGEVFVLTGDLGAGKTTFIQGLAAGMGVKNSITSPTFVLMKHYNADNNLRLVHIDCYRVNTNLHESNNESTRINTRNSLKEELGLDEIFEDRRNITVIEWGERIASILPENVVRMEFGYLGEEKRIIRISSKFKVQSSNQFQN